MLLLSAVACGGKDAPSADSSLRVEISGNAVDKPWPSVGFRLKAQDGHEIPLALVAGVKSEGPVLEGRGLPGSYALVPPPEWRVFGEHGALDIRPDVPPVKIGVGRKYGIYVWPPQGRSVSAIGLSRMPTSGVPLEVVEAESAIADDGSAVLRVPMAQWHGTLSVHAIFGPSTFAAIASVVLAPGSVDGDPYAVFPDPVYSAPVAVRVVRVGATGPQKPVELMASVAVAPLKVGIAVALDSKGRGTIEEVPRDVTGLSLFVRGTQAWDGLEAARLFREVRLLVVAESDVAPGTLDVHLANAKGGDRPVLQLRPEGALSYAMPSFTEERDGDDAFRMHATLPPGRYHALVTCGGRAAVAGELVEIASGKSTALPMRAADVANVRVSLVGGIAAVRSWVLVARRVEGDVEVEGQGFVVRGTVRADLDLELPPGRYRMRAEIDSSEGPAVDVDLSDPATHASIDLRPR